LGGKKNDQTFRVTKKSQKEKVEERKGFRGRNKKEELQGQKDDSNNECKL